MWSSQGSIPGPLLFIVCMNDPLAYDQDVSITLYGYDTSLDKAIQTSQQLKGKLVSAFPKVCWNS